MPLRILRPALRLAVLCGVICVAASIHVGAAPATAPPALPAEPLLKVVAQYSGDSAISGRPQADAERNRLYVPRADQVDVLDGQSGAVVGRISPVRRAGAVAIDAASQRGFAISRAADRIVVFDLTSLAIIKTIPSGGSGAEAIELDTETKRLFIAHAGSNDVGVIDAPSLRALGRVRMTGTPRQLVSNHYGRVFVTIGDRDGVELIDTRALRSLGTFALFGGKQPDGIDIDTINRRLFVASGNGKLLVLDSDIGFLLATLPIAQGRSGVAVDITPVPGNEFEKPAIVHAYVGSSDGPLTVVRMLRFDSFAVSQSLALQRSSQWLAVDRARHRVLIAGGTEGTTLAVAGR